MPSQVRHRPSQCHVVMILRMIVALRAVMHVRDLRLIVIARCVRILMIVVALTRVALARVSRRRRAPRESIVTVMNLVHGRRVARRRQLTRARRQRRRWSRECAARAASLGRRGAQPRISGRWIAGGRDQRRIRTWLLFGTRRRCHGRRASVVVGVGSCVSRCCSGQWLAVVAVAVVTRPWRDLRRGSCRLLRLLAALGATILEPHLEQKLNEREN